QPGLEARIVVAFQTEAHIDTALPAGAGGGDHGDVGFKIFRSHAHVVGKAVGQRTVAGEDDSLQPAQPGHGRILVGSADSMMRKRSVRVGFVEQRRGHSSPCYRPAREVKSKKPAERPRERPRPRGFFGFELGRFPASLRRMKMRNRSIPWWKLQAALVAVLMLTPAGATEVSPGTLITAPTEAAHARIAELRREIARHDDLY